MRKIFILLFLFCCVDAFAQKKFEQIADSLVAEAKILYRSEMASWYGTDVVLEKYKEREKIHGYFSYPDGDSTRCVFYTNPSVPKIIATISFADKFNTTAAVVNLTERELTAIEKEYFIIRVTALKAIRENNKKIFKLYENTDFNLIPVINRDSKKVYALTGPKKNGVIIFGNDYLFIFNNKNDIEYIMPLHKNAIFIEDQSDKENEKIIATMHSHLPETGELITVTDICTLMLYGKQQQYMYHYVISKEYVSIWDIDEVSLKIITVNDWKKSWEGKK